jgi:hypothetical protein
VTTPPPRLRVPAGAAALLGAAFGAAGAALAVLARAAGATPPVAVLLAPFALATGVLDVSDLHYPIDLAFTPDSWGALGLWTTVLGTGLDAAGRLRAATVVLGLLPAVHPGIAVLIAPVLLLVAAARLVDDPGTLRRVALPAALALAVSVGSLALHLLWLRLPLPPVDDIAAVVGCAVLTGPMLEGVQIRTGRPVTIETAQMDQIHDAPGLALGFHRVLRAAYGIDFAVLPPDGRRNRMLYAFEDDVRHLWEARTAADWSALGREFGFTAVWVRSGWRLGLAPLADDGRFAVFRVDPAP